jgi:hypothetical protein
MTTPPDDDARSAETVSFDKPAAVPATPGEEPAFDPYRFGAPDHPVPPEYAPPGYVPPAPPAAPAPPATPSEQPPPPPGYGEYPPYAGGQPYGQQPYPGGQQQQPYQPYPGAYYPPPPWTQYPPPPRASNGKATAALILGIVSIVFFWTSIFDVVPVVLAIVFGSIAINDSKRSNGTGRSMAVSGIVCGVIGALLAITFTVVVYTRIKPCLEEYDQGSSAQNTCIRDKF